MRPNPKRTPRTRAPRVEALEARALLSTLVAESEPNNRKAAADVATLDPADGVAILSGTISSRPDQDFFRLTPATTGTIRIGVMTTGRLLGKVSVEDAAGRKLFETEPNDGVLAGSFPAQAGRTVFIRVRPQTRG